MFDLMNKTLGDLDAKTLGVIILVVLATITAFEFILGAAHAPGFLIWIMALIKATTVIVYFMHLPRLFGSDEGEH